MKQILIVDDDATGRRVLRLRLEMRGYDCLEVEDGSAALKAIATHRFDLVITDHKMPVMTGLELLQNLGDSPECQRPPVIFITGQLSDDLRHAAQEAGARAVLSKPYDDCEIMIEITRLLKPQLHGNVTLNDRRLSSSPQ